MISAIVVLIHGAWLHASTWAPWCERLEARGHTCMAPAWPGLDGDPKSIRNNPPASLEVLYLQDIVDHYAAIIRDLPEPPVIIGHSFGGLVTLKLLDQGLGVAGVALEPAPPKGVVPRGTAVRASLPVVRVMKGGQKVHQIDYEKWAWSFGNAIPEVQRRAYYDEYVVPAPGRPFFEILWAGFNGRTKVDFANPDRPPLMIVAGTLDRTVPEKMVSRTWDRYARKGHPATYQVFDRGHAIVGEPGWEEVADLVISWVEIETGAAPAPSPTPAPSP